MKGFCDVDEGKIYFETYGKGEALLMLRGLGRSLRYWLGFEKIMAKHFRVILVDARGLGKSTAPMHWHHTVDDLAQDCLKVMSHLKIKRFHVFGLSLGGMVAMSLAAQSPERVKSLLVANSSSADYVGMRLQLGAIRSLALAIVRGDFHENVMKLVVPPATIRARGPEILGQWELILEAEGFPIPTIAKQLWASARFRIRDRIEPDRFPIMVLVSSLDRLVSPNNSRQLQKLLPKSKLRVVKGAGHEISLGHEEEVSKIIRGFAEGASQG